jgi:uncharacterized protein (DUF433 family)
MGEILEDFPTLSSEDVRAAYSNLPIACTSAADRR